MEKITYGAPRLVDWVAQIKTGAATVRVHFAGGALTSYGVTPAEYTTSNPFIQKVIENSNYFKEGRIIVMRRAKMEGPKKPTPKANPKAQQQLAPAPQPKAEEPVAETPVPAPQPKAEEPVAETPVPAPVPVETEVQQVTQPEPSTEEQAEEAETAGLTRVEVTCLPDAQAYLQENFNISSYKVRNCETAQLIAAEHGIQFTGGKFDTLNGKAVGETTEE